MSYPYLAKTILKYKSPHPTDLSFAKDETIRVTGPSEDDEDWLVGENLDGSRSGGFPKDFITPIEEAGPEQTTAPTDAPSAGHSEVLSEDAAKEIEAEEAPATSEPKAESSEAPVTPSALAPPSPKLEPASLPPSSTPAPASAPAPAPSTTSEAPKPQAGAAPGDSPPRPQSMKDRLAFFNAAQNKAAPPAPPLKPKPATAGLTWSQRQKLRQEQEAKEREAAGDPTPAPSATSVPEATPAQHQDVPAETDADKDEKEGSGMSAADALSSITKGGSLKERMAALAGHGAFGGGSAPQDKPAPPAPSGKVWKRPPAPAPEPEAEADSQPAGSEAEKARSPGVEQGDALAEAEAEAGEGAEEEDEEEKEKARRAAIAARMAKLGARGPMGMIPPAKPARKPTVEHESVTAPPAEKQADPESDLASAAAVDQVEPTSSATEAAPPTEQPSEVSPTPGPTVPTQIAAPPKSIPIAAMPRRTAPPRRRGAAPATAPASTASPEVARENPVEPENRFERTDDAGAPVPPPQVMVAGEEEPLPKTEAAKEKEAEQEDIGKRAGGLEGAAAAGIALAPVEAAPERDEEPVSHLEAEAKEPAAPLVGAVGSADSEDRGTGAILAREGQGEILSTTVPAQEVEEGVPEGGDEKDDIMTEAEKGQLELDDSPPLEEYASTPLSPDPIGMVPIHPPAADGSDYDEEEPPPPPPRRMSLDVPLDELELKHEQEHAHNIQRSEHPAFQEEIEEEEEEDEAPAPPRRISADRPQGPRPLPSPGRNSTSAGEGRLPPPPLGNPLIPPRAEDEDEDEEKDSEEEQEAPPLPPSRHVPPPAETGDDEETSAPPPPPVRATRPSEPAPASEVEQEEEEDAPPPPPARSPPFPTRQESNDQEDAPAPSPPARKPSLPPPLQTGVPAPAARSPTSPRATEPSPIATSPTRPRTLPAEPAPASPTQDEDATRRSGIAARMAKLGGIKFGMPPPTFKKQSQNVTSPTSGPGESEGGKEPASPIDHEPPIPSPLGETPEQQIPPAAPAGEDADETPEQEAARRRATLARLRAGGALGFGMFNQAQASAEPQEDARGIQEEPSAVEEEAPPPPPSRPQVPSGRPAVPPPADEEEEQDSAPPPPARPTVSTAVVDDDNVPPPPRVPHSPAQQSPASPGHPVRSPSGRRPPVPSEKRFSQSHKRTSTASSAVIPEDRQDSGNWQLADEPAVIMANQAEVDEPQEDAPPPPPPARPPPPPDAAPRRSTSTTSKGSRPSLDVAIPPATPSKSPSLPHQDSAPAPAQTSASAHASPARQPSSSHGGARPGFEQLKEASATRGAQLIRAAQNIFSQGKKAYLGDGSPAGFVLVALDHARIPRPEQGWGQVVFEQEGGSILRRYDEPRPGDIAAFYDSKLKGKKGLSTYNQHVGSVEEPLVGVVAEFEDRKHKLRVLQVERGTPEEVSYRCEDLKSGKILVYRPGL